MLAEIYCDKFMENGVARGPIKLNTSLNIVLGTETASNSIGKSSFLAAVDYAFGGDTYENKYTDIVSHIGAHRICFKFSFGDGDFWFSRSTDRNSEVSICDSNYKETNERMMINEYRQFLAKKYGLENSFSFSFRETVGPFSRIHQSATLDTANPMKLFSGEAQGKQVAHLENLFRQYNSIAQIDKNLESVSKELNVLERASEYKLLELCKDKKRYQDNCKRLEEIRIEKDKLSKNATGGFSGLSSVQEERLRDIQNQISLLDQSTARLEWKLQRVRKDLKSEYKTNQRIYDSLIQFFPEVNIKKVIEIDEFHKKLSTVLSNEFQDHERIVCEELESISSIRKKLEMKIQEIAKETDLTKVMLERFAELNDEEKKLDSANEFYLRDKDLKDKKGRLAKQKKGLSISILQKIEENINQKMKLISGAIASNKESPKIEFTKKGGFRFITPDDDGTGAKDRGLIVFDLALAELANLPFLIHDSILLKQIEDEYILHILECYVKCPTQVFIAFDKASKYSSSEVNMIANKYSVIKLGPNEHSLYGYNWGNKEQVSTKT